MAEHATQAALTVALTLGSEQIEAIARRVAELLRPDAPAPAAGGAPPSPLMTPAEAAAFLRRPRQYVYDSILKGRFTAKGTRARRLLLRGRGRGPRGRRRLPRSRQPRRALRRGRVKSARYHSCYHQADP
jgi:hypothetical protein